MIEIIYPILSMIGYGLSNAISKVPARELGSVKTVFYRNLFTSLIIFLIVLFNFPTSLSLPYLGITFLIAIIGYIPLMLYFKAIRKGDVGLISPIANSSIIYTVILSMIFFNEVLSGSQIMSIITILIGIILISVDLKNLKKSHLFNYSSGVPIAIIVSLLWGLVFFLFKFPVNFFGPVLAAFFIEFGGFITSAVHLKIVGNFEIKKSLLKYIIAISFLSGMGTVFFNFGITKLDVSIVSAIAFSSPFIAALYGKFVYKEKLNKLQWFSIVLIIIGLISISL